MIAGRISGRTDNQVKNHWNTHLSKRLGIKKVKSKVGASSQTILFKESGKSLRTCSASNLTPTPDCKAGAADPEVTENGSHRAAGVNSVQELRIDEDNYENHFWFLNDDLDSQVPSLMEFLDKSLDFVWNGM